MFAVIRIYTHLHFCKLFKDRQGHWLKILSVSRTESVPEASLLTVRSPAFRDAWGDPTDSGDWSFARMEWFRGPLPALRSWAPYSSYSQTSPRKLLDLLANLCGRIHPWSFCLLSSYFLDLVLRETRTGKKTQKAFKESTCPCSSALSSRFPLVLRLNCPLLREQWLSLEI